MALLPPNQLLHLGADPATGGGWNHFDLGLGLATHVNYPQSQLGNSPPQGDPWWVSKTNVGGKSVVQFSAPLGGATTSSGTQYARCELREYERDGTTKMAFDPRSDDHWIEGIYRIDGLSGLSKPSVCVMQAHDPNDDTIMVLTSLVGGVTKLILRYNGTQVATLDSSYVDGEEFYLKIRVNAGTPSVYYSADPNTPSTTPVTTSPASSGFFSGATVGWYFKSGSYNQTNESTDSGVDPDASIIKVEVRELKHWHSATPLGGSWPTPATYAATGTATVDAGADTSILPSGTFSRTAGVTLNGSTLTSQQWKIASGPAGAGNVLSTTASVSWHPADGFTTSSATRGLGVGGIAKPAAASNVELNNANRGDMNITASGTALVPRIYDGGGFTCGRVTISANYIVVQNYNIRPNSQYGVYITGSNVTVQNCDIKNISVSGDGDLNAITLLEGSNIDILYNTAINYVSGDPGDSHTDFIQTWVSSSHPTPCNNVRVIGNKATGPSNPSRSNSIASIHQCIMVEGAGHGGNSGGSGNPSNWSVFDNEFAGSWNQEIKLDGAANFTFTRNKFTGSSDHVFSFDSQTGSVVYSDNTFGAGYGDVGASITSGSGPANPITGGGGSTTTPYPNGNYVLEFDAVTSTGTASDTVTVSVSTTATGGVSSSYPTFVNHGTAATGSGSSVANVGAPSGVQNKDFQICIIQDAAEEDITSVPANWFLMDDIGVTNTDNTQPGGSSHAFVYYNTTGDSAARSWSKSGTGGYHAVRMAWRNVASLSAHLARASSYTTTPYALPVTPTTDIALVVGIMCSDRHDVGAGPTSVPNGWVARYSDDPTVNTNEVETITVGEIQVADQPTVGANAPTGTGIGTSNFDLTNPDNCSMFSFVLEGVISSGVTATGAVSLSAQPRLTLNLPLPGGTLFLTQNVTLSARSILRGAIALPITVGLALNAVVFPRGAFIVFPNLSFTTLQTLAGGIDLDILPVLRAGALPYRRPTIRTDYKYPPPNHPFRLIAQRILDGEIVEWELPVAEDFEYQVQLSGPCVMHGSFHPELISVQELGLDGYAYWLHVEINQEIRASAIMLPPQYEESTMTFSAEGVAAAPHYAYYDGIFSQIGVDPLSVVRTLWNYVQSQPQSDYGVTVSNNSSTVRLGEAATTQTSVIDNGDGTTTTNVTDVEAKPYEINWWDAKNVGEEIDDLAKQTPFDYVERHVWNTDKTDVLHFIDLGYPRVGVSRPTLLFNEENILEAVPVQEATDDYASAVLVIGAGDGADTIRAYRAEPFSSRVRREVVITDKSITDQARADARAASELAVRRGRIFEVEEIVVNAYHPNAPIGSYGIGDDVQVQIDVSWLMLTHIAWYRITSITNKPSSDKVRLGLARSDTLLDTSDVWFPTDDYVPPDPPLPPGATNWRTTLQLLVLPVLGAGMPSLKEAAQVSVSATTNLLVTAFQGRFGAVTLTVGKTLTANGIATNALGGLVTLTPTATLSLTAKLTEVAAIALAATPALSTGGGISRPGATALAASPSLTVGAGSPGGAATLAAPTTLSAGANLTEVAAVNLTVGKTLTAGAALTEFAAVALTVAKTLSANGTVVPGTVQPVIRASSTGGKSLTSDTSISVTKPTGLAVGDYMFALQVGDADTTPANMSCAALGTALASQAGNATSNYPTMKLYGHVATSTDVAASNFSFSASDVGDGAVILFAAQTGTYSAATPVTLAGAFTTQPRTSGMTQNAPSMTGVVSGMLLALFGTDSNNNTESYPSTGPSSMTLVAQKQGTPHYALAGIYSQILASTAATGTKSVAPTPSGITTNGWTTTAAIINPGP